LCGRTTKWTTLLAGKYGDGMDERVAWEILQKYVQDCARIGADSLIAVYAIGSLPGGYYRPGQSDIDAILIVKDGSQHVWGDSQAASQPLQALNHQYLKTYRIPKDFGPFPLQEKELYPPYNPEMDTLAQEIARLKVQGQCIYGHYDLSTVPMPGPQDFLQGARHFEAWWRDAFAKEVPPEQMSATACVNTMLIHLGRYLVIRRGIVEFNKVNLISTYLQNDPPYVDRQIFAQLTAHLEGTGLSESEVAQLREFTHQFRIQMNEHLGIEG
jgi:hypothetical protein